MRVVVAGLFVALALAAGDAPAHPLAPALLELREVASQRYAVLWRTSVERARGGAVVPQLPCTNLSTPERRIEAGDAVAVRWLVECPDLAGRDIRVDGLDAAGINVVVRIARRDASEISGLLGADAPAFVVPAADGESTFPRYWRLGVTHLLTGLDHLLFLLGLLWLVPTLRTLVATVTAFTAGHCATLSLVALGAIAVPQGPAEIAIAATALWLALELARPQKIGQTYFSENTENRSVLIIRRPWAMAGAFGLVHGLGFAGALREIGLPAGEVAIPLLAFNLGIEAAQLALVGVALLAAAAWRRFGVRLPARLATTHAIGALAAYWCIERTWMLAFGVA